MNHQAIIEFWFEAIEPKDWWKKSPKFDQNIKQRFLQTYHEVVAGEHNWWRESDEGRLAEIIVLDQFSRNMFRDQPEAFAQDSMALCLAQEAVRVGAHQRLTDAKRSFLLMPFMHSESRHIHVTAIELFIEAELEGQIDFEKRHKKIIDRFGRYPHRNEILGRASTTEEIAFLKEPGSSF